MPVARYVVFSLSNHSNFTIPCFQGRVTSIITTVFTAFTSFGLVAVSAWFASERWTFIKYRGQKWLDDVLGERWEDTVGCWEAVVATPPFMWIAWPFALSWRVISFVFIALKIAGVLAWKASCWIVLKMGRRTQTEDSSPSAVEVPSIEVDGETSGSAASVPVRPSLRSRPASAWKVPRISDFWDPQDVQGSSSTSDSSQGHISSSAHTLGVVPPPEPAKVQPNPPITPKDRFAQAVRSVITLQSFQSRSPLSPNGEQITSDLGSSSVLAESASPLSPSGSSSATLNATFNVKVNRQGSEVVNIRGARFNHLVPKLRTLQPTQDLMTHSALVSCLQFSPNGKFLATSSWDRTSAIFRVGVRLFC